VLFIDVGKSSQIDGIQQQGSNIDECKVLTLGQLGDHLALSNAGRSPDKDGLLNTNQGS
jgi:hypothetical protein